MIQPIAILSGFPDKPNYEKPITLLKFDKGYLYLISVDIFGDHTDELVLYDYDKSGIFKNDSGNITAKIKYNGKNWLRAISLFFLE